MFTARVLPMVALLVATSNVGAVAAESLTASKKTDSAKVFSQDHKHYAFIRRSGKSVHIASGEAAADSIWYGDTATHKAKELFEPATEIDTHEKIGKVPLADIEALTFSNDGKKLYFLIACFPNSGALIDVDLETGKLHYVTDSNSLEAIRHGEHAGELLLTRHKHHEGQPGDTGEEEFDYIKQ